MTTTSFLTLLFSFSVISGLTTEGIKNLIKDKTNFSNNILALIVALIIGGVGCGIYYELNDIPFNVDNTIYMILMGLATGLVSMTSYDKVKQTILQLENKTK